MADESRPQPVNTRALQRAEWALQDGNLAGLWTALHLFREHHKSQDFYPPVDDFEDHFVPLPMWLYDALFRVLRSYFEGSTEGWDWFKRWKMDQEHYDRYTAVMEGREANAEARENWKELKKLKLSRKDRAVEHQVGRTLERTYRHNVYGEVADLLARCEYVGCGCSLGSHVGEEAIKNSHDLVSRELRAGNKDRYYGGELQRVLWREQAQEKRRRHEEFMSSKADRKKVT